MSRGGMFNLVIFSRPRTPVALLRLTRQSCDRVRGVSGREGTGIPCGEQAEGRSTPSSPSGNARVDLETLPLPSG